jgi:hypothetical protein
MLTCNIEKICFQVHRAKVLTRTLRVSSKETDIGSLLVEWTLCRGGQTCHALPTVTDCNVYSLEHSLTAILIAAAFSRHWRPNNQNHEANEESKSSNVVNTFTSHLKCLYITSSQVFLFLFSSDTQPQTTRLWEIKLASKQTNSHL